MRAAGRGLALHPVELGDNPVDFAVSIERGQLVIGQPRKLEEWDGMSGRPLRRLGARATTTAAHRRRRRRPSGMCGPAPTRS